MSTSMTDHGGEAVKPLRSILAACSAQETSRETIEAALTLADYWHSELQVLTVIEMPAELDRLPEVTGIGRAEGERRLMAAEQARLKGLVTSIAPDRDIAVHVRVGKRFLEIIRHVLAHDIDMVVKTAEDIGGSLRFLFASTDQHLMRKCPCPLWLRLSAQPRALPQDTKLGRTILAAVDVDASLTDEPETQRALNEAILKTAAAMAAVDGATIMVLHVWDAPNEGLIRLWSPDTSDHATVDRYVHYLQTTHRRALDDLIQHAEAWIGEALSSRIVYAPMLRRGMARKVIPDEVTASQADLLIMGTIARTGVPGFIIGNTAEDVLNSVDCPVVTVKPPGYVSPVKTWPTL